MNDSGAGSEHPSAAKDCENSRAVEEVPGKNLAMHYRYGTAELEQQAIEEVPGKKSGHAFLDRIFSAGEALPLWHCGTGIGGRNIMDILHKARKAIDNVLSSACAIIFAAMVVIGTYQIITRFIFKNPSTISEELLTYSFTWMALLATPFVFGKRDHMRMGFMADKLNEAGRKVLAIVAELLIILLSGCVMIYGGFNIMKLTMTQSTASLGIPMGVVYTIIPVSGILILIYSILNIIDLAAGYAKAPGGEEEQA